MTDRTRHALAAEAHTHAAYEHWVAHFQETRGAEAAAHEYARRAYEHSQEGARLSQEALAAASTGGQRCS